MDEGEKGHEPTKTQEEDNMVLWDCVSMFSIEDEGLTEEEKISETNVTTRSQGPLKEDNTIMPNIKKLQENMKKIKNNTYTVNIPDFFITSKNPKAISTSVKSAKNKVENIKKNSNEHEMGYDIVEDIKKTKANISLFEMCNLPQQKEKLLKALEKPITKPQNDNQFEEEIGEASIGGILNIEHQCSYLLLKF